MDLFGALRGALAAYLGLIGLLGLGTLFWGVARYGPTGQWLAAAWFAIAGAGMLLTSVLLLNYAYGGGDEEEETVGSTARSR